MKTLLFIFILMLSKCFAYDNDSFNPFDGFLKKRDSLRSADSAEVLSQNKEIFSVDSNWDNGAEEDKPHKALIIEGEIGDQLELGQKNLCPYEEDLRKKIKGSKISTSKESEEKNFSLRCPSEEDKDFFEPLRPKTKIFDVRVTQLTEKTIIFLPSNNLSSNFSKILQLKMPKIINNFIKEINPSPDRLPLIKGAAKELENQILMLSKQIRSWRIRKY